VRILVLSLVYPNPKQPTFGIFVHERMRRVADRCDLEVVAPVPWFPMNRLVRGPRWTGLPAREERDGVPVHHPLVVSVPGYLKALDGLLYALSLAPFLARLRRRFPFDLIDAHFVYPDGVASILLARLFRCPVTITLRGTVVPISRFRLRRAQILHALSRANRVFAVSQSLKDFVGTLGADPGRIRVVPNGVDTEHFHPRDRQAARRALGIAPEQRVIVSVGALSPRKGHDKVLQVLPRIVARHPDVLYLVIGGPGPEGNTEPQLRALIAAGSLQAHARLVGPRPHRELPQWLAAADVFCLASSNEGRANAILEALACGVPVVATDVGGAREIVATGRDGIVVAPGDLHRLAGALIAALDGSWDRDAIAGRAAAHSWEATVAAVVEEFRALLAAGERRPVPDSTSEPFLRQGSGREA
jgi:teichuronic acid biosynthesis glycosyltransferase TuaC